jgi:hypothetical protein
MTFASRVQLSRSAAADRPSLRPLAPISGGTLGRGFAHVLSAEGESSALPHHRGGIAGSTGQSRLIKFVEGRRVTIPRRSQGL